MASIRVDDREIAIQEGESVLALLRRSNVAIRSLRHDPRMALASGEDDPLCVVDCNGRIVSALNTIVAAGMDIKTNSDAVRAHQLGVIEEKLKHHVGDCLPPCQVGCPCKVPGSHFIKLANEGRYEEALLLVRRRNPFAIVCGTVCPRFCEDACRRHLLDQPVAINDIKRFLAEWNMAREHPYTEVPPASTGKRVAIIGAGPAGVGLAHFLRLKGHEATIFEGLPQGGGMLRYGIPGYRLPKTEVDKEIKNIAIDLGVKIEYGRRWGADPALAVPALKAEGFSAVYLAIGAQKALGLNFAGADHKSVLGGVDFLREVTMGHPPALGRKVVVIGGGNVSIDVARTCRRLGIEHVVLTCILLKKDMPAHPLEIEEAEEEGVHIDNLCAPLRAVVDETGKLTALECMRRPKCADIFDFNCNIPGTEFRHECDTIILAIGQKMDQDACKAQGIPLTRRGYIDADANNGYLVNCPHNDATFRVYAGGDAVLTPATVVQAVHTANVTGRYLDAWLRNVPVAEDPLESGYLHTRGTFDEFRETVKTVQPPKPKRVPYFEPTPRSARVAPPMKEGHERVHDWNQVARVFTEEEARRESARCMQCGCADAERCLLKRYAAELGLKKKTVTPLVPQKEDTRNAFLVRDLDKCVGCTKCARACGQIRNCDAIDPALPELAWKAVDMSDRSGAAVDPTSCESCGTCLDVCPVNAIFPKTRELQPDTELRTSCCYCGCGCGMKVGLRDGHPVRILGDPASPASHGQLCVKGRFGALDFVKSKDRLTQPLIRNPATGQLEPATWEAALSLVARRLTEIKAAHGANAIAGFSSARITNEDNYCFMKFVRATIGTNNVDHCARLCHASTVAGLATTLGSGAMTNSIDEIGNATCILVTGSNTTETHPIIGLKVREACKKGAKLIVCDPRRINLCRFAHLHIKQRSGTDVMLYNSMMQVIISENLAKREFIAQTTEKFEDMMAEVMKPCYAPEEAAKVCGVPADDIRAAARCYATSERSSIIYSMGITQHSTGVDNVITLSNLVMLTGQIGRPSTGVNPLRGQNNVQGACDLGALPNVYSGYQKVVDPAVQEKFSKAWGRPLDNKIGLTVTHAMNKAYEGVLKAVYCVGENPAVSDPNLHHCIAALERLEFLVVQDIFLTPTARKAHVVLPAFSFLEKNGTFTNTERRVVRVRPVTRAPGQARDDWDIISDISRRMGYDLGFSSSFDIMEEARRLTPSYGGMAWTRLDQTGGLQWPCPSLEHPGTQYLHKDGKFTRGKGLFVPVPFRPPAEVPDAEYPLIMTTGRLLYQYHTGTQTRRCAGLNELAPSTHVEVSAEDAAKLHIVDKEVVEVITRRGRLRATALVPSRVREGVVFLPFHFEEAPANILTNDALDPVASIPEFKACACRIEKVAAGAPAPAAHH